MKILSLVIFISLNVIIDTHAGWFGHDNYWDCLLEEMQNVQSDTIAKEVVSSCKDKFAFHDRVFVEKRYPWFGVKTASACVIKYGKRIQTEIGARYIQSACYKLYPEN